MRSWSGFATPASGAESVWRASRDAFRDAGHPLAAVTLVIGPGLAGKGRSRPGFVAFAFEVVDGSETALVDETQSPVAGPVSARLAAEVWALSGDSSTDSVQLDAYRDGRVFHSASGEFDSLPRLSRRCPFDLEGLQDWAEFGSSGAEPDGLRLALDGDGTPSLREQARGAVRSGDAAAQSLIEAAVDAGEVGPVEAGRMYLELGRPVEALRHAIQGQPLAAPAAKLVLLHAALGAGQPEVACALADDDSVPDPERARLLVALGRYDRARELLLPDDLRDLWLYEQMAESALDNPDPRERIERLSALDVDPVLHPAWDLALRCDLAAVRLQLGQPVSAALLDEVDRVAHPSLRTRRERLALPSDPIAALRAALELALASDDDERIARAHGDLGLALVARGATDAAHHLEEAFVRLGTSSPYTAAIRAALERLGLL